MYSYANAHLPKVNVYWKGHIRVVCSSVDMKCLQLSVINIKNLFKEVGETPYCYFWGYLRNIWLHSHFVYFRGKQMKSAGDTITVHQEFQALQRLYFLLS